MKLRIRHTAIFIVLTAAGLAGCASQQRFQEEPPFTVSEQQVRPWTGGRAESGSGMRLSMRWNPHDPEAYRPDSLYFRGRVLSPVIEDSETGMLLTASYELVAPEKPDMVMHADPKEEVGNQPPAPLPDGKAFPFALEPDEAVLSYVRLSDGTRYYYKITGIAQKPVRAYPSRPQE